MRHCLVVCSWIFFTLCAPAGAAQQPLHNGLALQGFTGILNTPSAHVTEEGWLYALYSNQEESKWRQKARYQDNYLFSLGLFNFIELGGRFIEAPGTTRDLSANMKITSAPLTRNYPLAPVVAAGMQDISGGAVNLKTSYLVISEDIWRLRLSAGYGHGPDRMKGLFAGGEFKAQDWLYLLGEYDSKETNVGARVVLPQFWKVPVNFTATAKTSLSYKPGSFEVAFGLSIPLDFKMRKEEQELRTEDRTLNPPPVSNPALRSSPAPSALSPQPRTPNLLPRTSNLPALRDSLIGEGFLNVQVGTSERTLVVEYENTIFNHNELDALGLVAGLAADTAAEDIDTLRMVIKQRNIRLVAITMPLSELRGFMDRADGLQALRDHLVVNFDTSEAGVVNFAGGDDNSGLFNTSLILAPALTTYIGTEIAAFDYQLSLKPELTTMLWKGAAVNARWNLPLAWSDNLDDGKPYRNNRQPAQLERLMLFQAVQLQPTVMLQLGAGMVLHDRNGMLNEAVWSPGDGEHRFRIIQGWSNNATTHRGSDQLLGSYRYFFSPLDLSLEGTVGKFWSEDKGFSLELKRFWEDTAVSLYYKDTKGTDDKSWQAVGIQFSFPLTPRRDMRPLAKMQLRGSDEWSYGQETTLENNNVNSPRGNLNYLAPYPLAINPQPSAALYRTFYNRDRLSASYISKHLERLREAWLKYRPETIK